MSKSFVQTHMTIPYVDIQNIGSLIDKTTVLYNNMKMSAIRTILTLISADVPDSDKWSYRDKLRHENRKTKNKGNNLTFTPYSKKKTKQVEG